MLYSWRHRITGAPWRVTLNIRTIQLIQKSRLTPMDPRDELYHAQSPIALHTKLNAECDQQVTVVGRSLTALCHVHRRSQVLSVAGLSIALGDGG